MLRPKKRSKAPEAQKFLASSQVCVYNIITWDLSFRLPPKAQKLPPGGKLAKIFDF
jgi:hypothetical protein